MWRPGVDIRYLSQSTSELRQVSTVNLELTDSSSLTDQRAPQILLLVILLPLLSVLE